jgi:hypothetical protein
MIALCTLHHPHADGDAYTKDQLRQFKEEGVAQAGVVQSRFNWLRSRLLVHVGGNHYVDTHDILRIKGQPILWFSRDEVGHWLLNMRGVSQVAEPRFAMQENFWVVHGNQEDLECAPSGKLLKVMYPNGDEYSVEFHEILDEQHLLKRYPKAHPRLREIETPITGVDITYRVAGTRLDLGPSSTQLGGIQVSGGLIAGCVCAFDIA